MMTGGRAPEDERVPAGADAFAMPEEGDGDPRVIAAGLVADRQSLAHLRHANARIMFLMRQQPKAKGGKVVLGEMCLPQFRGSLGDVAKWLLVRSTEAEPDFIMILDQEWWDAAEPRQRMALVHHELLHAAIKVNGEGEEVFDADGNPIWMIRAHDIEEFNEVAEDHGAWLPDIARFVDAATAGEAVARKRRGE